MKKVKLYIYSFFCLAIFVLSLNKPFMEWWSDYRIYPLKAFSARSRYGDLYSACFLPNFMDTSLTKLKTYNTSLKNTNLYILHDSYLLGRIKTENFKNLNKLFLVDYRGDEVYVQPDTTKRNIIIIECSERTAGWRLTDTAVIFSKLRTRKPIALNKNLVIIENTQVANYFFNPFINQNLEFNLFDYELFKPIKEYKAIINYYFFNRIPKDIVVSINKNYLLLNETVDVNQATSSFRYISDEEINYDVYCVNYISQCYKNMGFDEIYFSIIPNPVSIIDAGRMPYNHKIERIETNYFLRTNYIDVYTIFTQSKKQIYRRDDSHWNNYGLQLWLDEVNNKILQP